MELLLHTNKNLEIISELQKKFPNDFDLGREIRKIFSDNSYIISIPNNGDLGAEIRKIKKNSK